jgi:hypothetical protein
MNSVIQAACIQAAAVLVAARNAASNSLIIDVEACVKRRKSSTRRQRGKSMSARPAVGRNTLWGAQTRGSDRPEDEQAIRRQPRRARRLVRAK